MVFLGSCEKVPLLAPVASTITIVSNRTELPFNGTAQIIATVIEQSGSPAHNGTLVTFTTTLGTLEPREAVTSNGQAVVTLHAGTQSGVATIAAYSGGAQSGAGADGTAGSALLVTIGGVVEGEIPLNVNLEVDQQPATVGEVVTFTANATSAGNAVTVTRYEWDLGDGTTVTTSGNILSNVYTSPDTYTVKVTAVTPEGVRGSTQITLVVVPLQIQIAITVSPLSAAINQPVSFTATVTPASVVVTQYDWDFGDGSLLPNGGRVTSHPYSVAGTYIVEVTVTLADSSKETSQAQVTVRP